MLRQQNGVVTPHLGHPSIDPALDGYPTKKKVLFNDFHLMLLSSLYVIILLQYFGVLGFILMLKS